MVDYTKPEFRDVQWSIWKGGAKLADELRAFYTSKKAAARLAMANPLSAAQPATHGCAGCARRRMQLKAALSAFQERRGRSPVVLRNMIRKIDARIEAAKASVAPSGPSQDKPNN